eukprot:comp16769_c0_seq1/m.27260 comp16769_c0_seq1/g.27260  ORF comp16769_c0_seq1/g.27260 comp16769_c0_seq1/m.27260 type:complete len:320 (-) comp16769_c0_seq1:196-1155(-)
MASQAYQAQQSTTPAASAPRTRSGSVSVAAPVSGRLNRAVFQDKYVLKKQLGDGTFAKVYLIQDKYTGQYFAGKVIEKSQWKNNPDVMRALQREIALLEELDHPNMIHLVEYFDTPQQLIIVTEVAHGGDLLEYLVKRGPLKEHEAAQVFFQICKALEYMHQNGMVHRDLKPENILIEHDWTRGAVGIADNAFKLCDFGQAARLADRHLEGQKSSFGTYEYVAPEVINGALYDLPMDVWSLGVVLFILVTGVFPFEGSDRVLFEKIKLGRYRYPSKYVNNLSQQIKDLIQRMLTIDTRSRYTMQDVLVHPFFQMWGVKK